MKHLSASLLLIAALPLVAAERHPVLPADEPFNDAIPAPAGVLGWPVGEWHARPEQITQYFRQLVAASPRAELEVIGRTHEQRPLLHLYITSAGNRQNLEALRQRHLAGGGPLVIWLGYSIHGDEASGSNAALLVAYHLLAGEAEWINELLAGTVVIIDPMLNPDGLARFATWANMHKGQQTVADKLHREHNQGWPSGRFNHYWFDLNRDWLPVTQPESAARIRQFQRWQPNIFGDFHEQGSDAGYFFQPGVPERKNPLTPAANERLTKALGRYHAPALDAIGVRYFTRERFDDFYYGKGSTYPDINGGIGILYEQASARGHRIESDNGVFSFADAVRNHYATSLSTLKGGHALRRELLDWQQAFFEQAGERARQKGHQGWVFANPGLADGPGQRARQLAGLLQSHGIEVRLLAKDVEIDGFEYASGQGYVVPVRQRQAALIEAMFEQRTEFADNSFYDVSAWTLPLAYNLAFGKLQRLPETAPLSDAVTGSDLVQKTPDTIAWRFAGDDLDAAGLAIALANGSIPVYRVIDPARELTPASSVRRGDFIVPLLHNSDHDKVVAAINGGLETWRVKTEPLSSGLDYEGIDLGSPGILPLVPVKPLLLVGRGFNPMETGHIWHLLDRRLRLPLPMLDVGEELPDLSPYSHLLLADAEYQAIPEDWIPAIQAWVRQGGILIAQQRSAEWAGIVFADDDAADDQQDNENVQPLERIRKRLAELAEPKDQSREQLGRQPYADYPDAAARRVLGGAIFMASTDTTHPLMTGIHRSSMPVFLNRLNRLQPGANAWSTPLALDQEVQPAAGYASDWMLEQLQNQPLLIAGRIGRGAVVRFAFNANFRAFWRGTEQLYINALVNTGLIGNTTLPAH